MKTFLFLISFFGIQSLVLAQSSNLNTCSVFYSQEIESYFFEDSSDVSCTEIIIKDLPPLSQSETYFKLNFVTKGRYSFKKASGLIVPDNYKIYIEDQLTGQTFDLRTEETYSFSHNRVIPNRFILFIKPQDKLTSKRN